MHWWLEPTLGASHTRIVWSDAAQAIGFENGTTIRIQGGVRLGTTYTWGNVQVEPTLTGLAYADVVVRGGTIAQAAGGAVVPTDEGKVFGQGIGKLNFLWTTAFSTYVEAEVRGRTGVFGAAGRVGARYTW